MPYNTILRSATGDPGTWEDVSGIIAGTTNIRAITTWNSKLYVAASVTNGQARGRSSLRLRIREPRVGRR